VGASPDQWLVVREATPRNTPWAPSGVARLADFNLYHIRSPLPVLSLVSARRNRFSLGFRCGLDGQAVL